MSKTTGDYFELSLDSLRALGSWAADCAEKALPVYEALFPADPRPRAAIDGIRVFAAGARRTAQLRTLALAAFSAARESGDAAAAAAANAAASAAASAYTHPLAQVTQTKHVLGSAAYAAFALELAYPDDPGMAASWLQEAIDRAAPEACAILRQMPCREAGKGRLNHLLHELDLGLRARGLPPT